MNAVCGERCAANGGRCVVMRLCNFAIMQLCNYSIAYLKPPAACRMPFSRIKVIKSESIRFRIKGRTFLQHEKYFENLHQILSDIDNCFSINVLLCSKILF